jgi:hypothetical protein
MPVNIRTGIWLISQIFCFALLFSVASSVAAQESKDERIQKAIEFLRTACVTKGSSLDFKIQGDGALRLRGLLGSGIKGSITLSKKELEGFADAASELSAQQASEMRKCMKPYIDRILGAMLSGHTTGDKEVFTIQAEGNYFRTKEFDLVVIYVANNSCHNVSYISNISDINIVKIRYYVNVMYENQMSDSTGYPCITAKGDRYLLSKGLVK